MADFGVFRSPSDRPEKLRLSVAADDRAITIGQRLITQLS